MVSTGICWVLQVSTGLYLLIKFITSFYWVLRVSIGFYRCSGLLVSTGSPVVLGMGSLGGEGDWFTEGDIYHLQQHVQKEPGCKVRKGCVRAL